MFCFAREFVIDVGGGGGGDLITLFVFILFKIVASGPKFDKTKTCGEKIIKFLQNCSVNILEIINK